jgi:hypothetical protein
MQYSFPSRTRFVMVAALTAAFCHGVYAQDAAPADAKIRDAKGIPPRAMPTDYQAHAQVGPVTIGAEFTGHSIATPEAILTTEDYVAVEVGLFGPPDARAVISTSDFSLRINGKKVPSPGQPYAVVFGSLKDPDWAPPQAAAKSKTSIGNSGGGGGDLGSTPAPVHVPIEVERAMQLRVQKASLPVGDRALPEAGLIFFQHRGKINAIHSLELIYEGPAGKASLTLQP